MVSSLSFAIGFVAYHASVILDASLARRWRTLRPAFFWFLLIDCLVGVIGVPQVWFSHLNTYNSVFWYARPLMMAALCAAAGELAGRRGTGLWAGSLVGLIEAEALTIATARSAYFLFFFDDWAMAAIAAVLLVASFRLRDEERNISLGLGLFLAACVATNSPGAAALGSAWRLVRTVAYLAAQVIWLRADAARELQPD